MLAWLQLCRLPAVFTAVANVLMGYLFVHPTLQPTAMFGLLLSSSTCLYLAGMVWNDFFDAEQDRLQRPERPLPSGRISRTAAGVAGAGLLAGGMALAWLVGPVSGWLASLLGGLVMAYDAVLKRSWLGPVAMGGCRFLNVLLAMSTGPGLAGSMAGFDRSQLAVAAGIGTFVAGVTWFARQEAERPARGGLLVGLALMVLGFVLLAVFPQLGMFAAGARTLTFRSDWIWVLLLVGLGFPLLRRCIGAIVHPSAGRVQATVKSCLVSLIMIDAAVCLAVRTPWWWSACILALLVPTSLLGRKLYIT